MRRLTTAILGAVALATAAAGCTPGLGGGDSPKEQGRGEQEQGRREQSIRLGVVDSVREVKLEGAPSGIGPAAGAVIGGIGGSGFGHGRGSAVGAVVGTVAGGVAGQAVEDAAARKPGLEITIRLENGQLIAVTQGIGESFQPGDHVRVLSDGVTTRVTH